MPRYRFSDFVLSPRRRVLLRNGLEQPLIPRYFDLLVYLIERRGDAVHRRDIFDAVWTDVIVSDSALSQAIRTIRRVLDDDPRDPRFVRTVSRHGYQFVYAEVFEEEDNGDRAPIAAGVTQPQTATIDAPAIATTTSDPFGTLLDRLSRPALTAADEEDQRDAAERLHALGTAEALKRLDSMPNSALARAVLRDTRWDTPQAGPVPILGTPGAGAAAWHLIQIRLNRAADLAAARWTSASAGGAMAGAIGGVIGGLMLVAASGNVAPFAVVPVLGAIGALCGGLAGAGVGAGMAMAESVLRSWRTLGTIAGGAIGGGSVGLAIELMSRWTLEVLVGTTPPIGGGLDGLLIGGAVATGYALATREATGGAPAPRGSSRMRVALVTAGSCALVALAISLTGRPLVGGTVHLIARSVGGHGLLGPLGRLIGEPDFGPVSAAFIAFGEGLTFGFGVAFGLTRRR